MGVGRRFDGAERLRREYRDEHIALMREGLKGGMTIPRASLAGVESSIQPLPVLAQVIDDFIARERAKPKPTN